MERDTVPFTVYNTEPEPRETPDLYLVWSNQHRAWWRGKSAGYTTKLSSAGRYSHEEAIKICAGAHGGWNKDIPPEIPVRLNDAAACYVLTPRIDWNAIREEREASERQRQHSVYDNDGGRRPGR